MKKYKEIIILGFVCLLSCLLFLAWSLGTEGPGFPLDDAWIHQAFARNFANSFSWSFQLGQPSGGSTGPLWGLLLAGIHGVGIPEVWGTLLLGCLLLWVCSVSVLKIGGILFPDKPLFGLLLGVMFALEWHMVWAALSGMETILLIWLILLVILWILSGRENWWIPGILIGISIWVRPDGITLLGPVLFYLFFKGDDWKKTIRAGLVLIICLIVAAGPYFIFNQLVAGEIWPSTFYAKQAEYAILREVGFFTRLGSVSLQVITGVGIMLLPGLIMQIIQIVKGRDWGKAGIFLWAAGYIGIYAARLPVVYQHGRYIMPAIAVILILGAAGMAGWIELGAKSRWKRIGSAVWSAAAAIVLIGFWVMGARAYANDVGVIETEMVETARWIAANLPEHTVLGAHDIGGLGYFGEREIIDLAGLVTPDVIPFIRDEAMLADYLNEKGAEYLVTFPGWYPELVQGLTLLYESSGEYTSLYGMDRMSVYIWK